MTLGIHTKPDLPDRTRGAARGLLAGATLLLAAGGLGRWWSRGAAVFGDIVLAAVAWCF